MAQPTISDWKDSLPAHVLTVLQANPTDEIAAKFTKAFKQRFPDADLNDLSIYERFTASVTSDDDSRSVLRGLLFDVAFSPVACLIATGVHSNLEGDILSYLTMLATNSNLSPDPSCFVPLLWMAVTGVSSITVWRTLFDIFSRKQSLAHTYPATANSSIRAQTPVSSNSYSLSPMSEVHQVIDQRLRHELDGVLYPNVAGFITTYFPINPVIDRILEEAKPVHLSNGSWTAWPSPPIQDRVLNWFSTCVNGLLPSSTTRRFATSANNPLRDSLAKGNRKPDIFLCDRDPPHEWSDVLVVGELKQSNKDTLSPTPVVEFAGYVRMVFISQPYRRFVHAFTLAGDLMRCWIFHRGGGFASELFCINTNPERFLCVVVGYATMSRTELGFDPTVSPPNIFGQRQLTLSGQIYLLKPSTFFLTPAIACRGTLCTEAKLPGDTEYHYIIKDAWRSECYASEGLLLHEAQAAGVECLVEYIGHEDVVIDSIPDDICGNIMRGLDLTGIKPLYLRPAEPRPTRSSQNYGPERETTRLRMGPIAPPLNQSAPRKRSQPNSLPQPPTKRIAGTPSSTPAPEAGGVSFNRVHTRLITGKGRPIYTYMSYLHLLLAFHDAITCHRALLRHGVLHRDISLTNILIPVAPRADGARGFLIDLDLALCLSETADGMAHHRTGTMQFMAIGALSREQHTYRHDLESFFYVFLWVCVHYQPGGAPVTPYPTTLDAWGAGGYSDAAARKSCDMEPGGFVRVVAGFPWSARGMVKCASAWREVLFPWRGLVWKGTDADYESVYRCVLGVLADAVRGEGGEV